MEEEPRLGFVQFGDADELLEIAQAEMVSEEEDDFEFAFSIESDPGSLPDSTADEIFYNGRILPVYPLFNRDLIGGNADPTEEENLAEGVDRLMLEYQNRDTRSGSSSSSIVSVSKGVERVRRTAPLPINFTPQSPDRCRKSSSTGSSASASASRRWKLRDLVVGRSRSDGKERFVAIPLPDEKEKEKEKKTLRNFNSFAKSAPAETEKKEKNGKGKEMDIVTAHRIYYGKVGSGSGQPAAPGSYRRSFLPYRQELLGGIFGNAKHHPF